MQVQDMVISAHTHTHTTGSCGLWNEKQQWLRKSLRPATSSGAFPKLGESSREEQALDGQAEQDVVNSLWQKIEKHGGHRSN